MWIGGTEGITEPLHTHAHARLAPQLNFCKPVLMASMAGHHQKPSVKCPKYNCYLNAQKGLHLRRLWVSHV